MGLVFFPDGWDWELINPHGATIVIYQFDQESGILYLDKQQQIANNSIIQKKERIPLSKESW